VRPHQFENITRSRICPARQASRPVRLPGVVLRRGRPPASGHHRRRDDLAPRPPRRARRRLRAASTQSTSPALEPSSPAFYCTLGRL